MPDKICQCGSPVGKGRSKYCDPCAKKQKLITIRNLNKLYAKKFWLILKDESRAAKRTCLSCERAFMSTGPGNRICDQCKRRDIYDYDHVPAKIFIPL